MRGGAQLHCVVNGPAGAGAALRIRTAAAERTHRGDRRGSGGLTYASLVVQGNAVTVFERAERPGGSFRYAGKAPLFQDVVANQESFDRYVRQLEAACAGKGVAFRYGVDVTHWPELLRPFDRIVIATGAAYRFGLAPVATVLAGPRRRSLAARQAGPFVSSGSRLVLPPGPHADRRSRAGLGAWPRPEGES